MDTRQPDSPRLASLNTPGRLRPLLHRCGRLVIHSLSGVKIRLTSNTFLLSSTGSGRFSPPTAPAPKDLLIYLQRNKRGFGGWGLITRQAPKDNALSGRGVSHCAPLVGGVPPIHSAQNFNRWWKTTAFACASLPNSQRVGVIPLGGGARKNAPLNQGLLSVRGVGGCPSTPNVMEVT